MKRHILVTGGLGYIGSHIVLELLKDSDNIIIIIDNFSNSNEKVVEILKDISTNVIFHQADTSETSLEEIFSQVDIDFVIHLAGSKSVEESIASPIKYYENNFVNSLVLVKTMLKYNIPNLIFSSSATVYGDSPPPHSEESPTGRGITNPYGRTKFFIEEMLVDVCKSNPNFNVTILRYFNPIGATLFEGGKSLGEIPSERSTNLIPTLLRKIEHNSLFSIFGNDYDTPDGTAIRDFIHVRDLARGHTSAMRKMKGCEIYNLGTGWGVSIEDLLSTFERVNSIKIERKFCPRREGDLPVSIGKVEKIFNAVGWQCEETLEDALRESYLHYIRLTENK